MRGRDEYSGVSDAPCRITQMASVQLKDDRKLFLFTLYRIRSQIALVEKHPPSWENSWKWRRKNTCLWYSHVGELLKKKQQQKKNIGDELGRNNLQQAIELFEKNNNINYSTYTMVTTPQDIVQTWLNSTVFPRDERVTFFNSLPGNKVVMTHDGQPPHGKRKL